MLRIGLMSDTHGYLDPKIFEVFKDVDEIWHAGDIGTIELADTLKQFKPLFGVYGNIDGKEIRKDYPLKLELQREGLKILMIHIGGYPGHYEPKARASIEAGQPDIFICGHSHILKVMRDERFNKMLVMNPGAAGSQGFHKIKTVLRFALNNKKVENLEAVELGKRGELPPTQIL
jgi:putative phosphoesterase